MNKICTSLEQSKKLVELGIDPSTADMFYCNGMDIYTREWGYDLTIIDEINKIDIGDIPAWSLSALLELMPSAVLTFHKKDYKDFRFIALVNQDIKATHWHQDPIDAAFEMICWLKENGYI